MSFTSLTGVKRSNQSSKETFFTVKLPQVIFIQGKRMAGKDYVLENCVTTAYENGITSFHGWGARNNENAFYAYNNNCKHKWELTLKLLNTLAQQENGLMERKKLMKLMNIYSDEIFDFYINQFKKEKWVGTKTDLEQTLVGLTEKGYEVTQDEPLHCNCHKAYPITMFVPSYISISQESIDRFNQQYFWDYKEYQEAFLKSYVNDILPKSTNFWKLPKPPKIQKDVLKVVYFTVPTKKKQDVFMDQFKRYLLGLRSDHRIGVQNPRMFAGPDKFMTLATEINALPNIMTSPDFSKPTEEFIGKPEHMWNKWERSWDKLLIALGELKTIVPSQKMSGEIQSTDTKRALFDKVGEWRHWKMWLIGSYQNPEDLYAGVRYQADYIGIKRASKNLLGDDFAWLFADIEEKRREAYRKSGISEDMLDNTPWLIDRQFHTRVNREYPRVQNLPDDIMVVTDIDNSWYYLDVPELNHHHKHTLESFDDVFKLDIKMIDESTGEAVSLETVVQETDDEKPSKNNKSHHELMERVDYLYDTQHKKMPEIVKELTPKEEWEVMDEKKRKTLIKNYHNQYGYWKQSQKKRDINKTFSPQA